MLCVLLPSSESHHPIVCIKLLTFSEMCQETIADLGLVSLLVRCLEMSQSPGLGAAGARQFRTKCILALSICVDQCGEYAVRNS